MAIARSPPEPDRRRYFFDEGFGAEAAFFTAFCFLVLEVFFGLLSPIGRSSPSRFRQDTNLTPPSGSRHAAMDAITKSAYLVLANSSMVDSVICHSEQRSIEGQMERSLSEVGDVGDEQIDGERISDV